MNDRHGIIKNAVREALVECEHPKCVGTAVIGGHFDKFKYKLAKDLVPYFLSYEWITKVWYADLSGGEFMTGDEKYGRDLDILIEGNPPRDFDIEKIESGLEQYIELAMEECNRNLKKELKLPNIIELHLNDDFVSSAKNRLTNAIKLYERLV